MTIPMWLIPLGVTVCFWGWAILAPWPPSRGDYDFSGMFTGLIRLAVAVTGTLMAWLVFFAAKVAAQ